MSPFAGSGPDWSRLSLAALSAGSPSYVDCSSRSQSAVAFITRTTNFAGTGTGTNCSAFVSGEFLIAPNISRSTSGVKQEEYWSIDSNDQRNRAALGSDPKNQSSPSSASAQA